jgi:hypothetical protein
MSARESVKKHGSSQVNSMNLCDLAPVSLQGEMLTEENDPRNHTNQHEIALVCFSVLRGSYLWLQWVKA